MGKLYLFTENNRVIGERLPEFDCRHLLSESPEFTPGDMAVYQISDDSLRLLRERLPLNPACEHIIATEKITPEQRDFFLQNGIARVIQTIEPEKISAYIKTKVSAEPESAGTMLVYDDKRNTSAIIRAITSHFGYETAFTDSTSGFFKSMTEGEYHFILINLGCEGLDIADFVRGCDSHPKIKTGPLIAYKDAGDGLLIHEITSGINRYISYILSPEELYGFLLDILFKKEFMPLIRQLNIESRFNEFSRFCDAPLKRIYYETKGNILALSNILNKDSILSVSSAMTRIEESLIRVSALDWLRFFEEKPSIEQAGYLCDTPIQTLSRQTPAANKL
ncbi:MAG: hypothetical protein FWG13_02405 [Leptospirales bacterium]|nr:hypothetical protein [Leptospirales bacterium]